MHILVRLLCFASLAALSATSPVRGESQEWQNRGVSKDWVKTEQSAAWCGAKGLWLVCRGYGLDWDLEAVKQACDPAGSSNGYLSLFALARAAEQLGLAAQPVKCEMDWLKQLRTPALTVHRVTQTTDSGESVSAFHCVVLLEYEGEKFHALDPFFPSYEVQLSDEQFARTWTGEALLVARRAEDLPAPSHLLTTIVLCLVADALVVVLVLVYARRRRLVTAADLSLQRESP